MLRSNNERAFVISQLQDLLGRGSLLEDPQVRQRLASHIDLLAFSILDTHLRFVVFSISQSTARTFAECIATRLQAYQSEWHIAPTARTTPGDEPHISCTHLAGPFAALNESVSLHLDHSDWEYDRYSSISFYLHDRRGDWMHLWRVSELYENNPALYLKLLRDRLEQKEYRAFIAANRPFDSTTPWFGPLSHAL